VPSLNGKVVVITGALGNLGTALTAACRAAGARLVLVDRFADKLFDVYGRRPDQLLIGDVDLGEVLAAAGVFEQAQVTFGSVDGLVHTVGGFRGGKPLAEDEPDDWDYLYAINVRTTLHTCRAALPYMIRQQRGSIVTIGSRAALAGEANYGPYCAAKGAVLRITEAIAAEVQPFGVRANCVLPGTLDTPQNRAAMPTADTSTWVPLAELANVIVYLLSDASQTITGAGIPVHGKR
jgi:NAD(P)-dependent dehydrogenase (short-subunit alcohol dehydrogenase family)